MTCRREWRSWRLRIASSTISWISTWKDREQVCLKARSIGDRLCTASPSRPTDTQASRYPSSKSSRLSREAEPKMWINEGGSVSTHSDTSDVLIPPHCSAPCSLWRIYLINTNMPSVQTQRKYLIFIDM